MWSILIPTNPEAQDSLVAALWEQGTTGIIEEPDGLRAFFDDATDPAQLRFPASEIRRESAGPQEFAQENWDAILIGERFFIAPPWVNTPAPAGRFRLSIDAATAFGTGRHETTQLCIEAMERHLRAGACVLDIGCGSGILSAAASLLHAGPIFSCDIHEDAMRSARHHIHTPLFQGSADAIRPAIADVVLANISARIVDHIAADLKRVLKSGALLILSGFIAENPPKHFQPVEQTTQGDWLCWVCRSEDIHPGVTNADPNLHPQEWWL